MKEFQSPLFFNLFFISWNDLSTHGTLFLTMLILENFGSKVANFGIFGHFTCKIPPYSLQIFTLIWQIGNYTHTKSFYLILFVLVKAKKATHGKCARVEDILDFSDFVYFSYIFLYTNGTVDIPIWRICKLEKFDSFLHMMFKMSVTRNDWATLLRTSLPNWFPAFYALGKRFPDEILHSEWFSQV